MLSKKSPISTRQLLVSSLAICMFTGLLLTRLATFSLAGGFSLGEPPLPPITPRAAVLPGEPLAPGLLFTGPLSVNPQNRTASRNFFKQYYQTPDENINWTGNRATCNAGDTDIVFRETVLQRLNYFRAMAGVPAGVLFDDTLNAMCQKAALMMSVNNQLSHSPPDTWSCYTADGAQAAGKSNLALGAYGRQAIGLYMSDSGVPSLGHRRWLLYPQTTSMGTGDVPNSGGKAANCLWVIDSHYSDPRPATREEFVAWPPPGYIPYQVVYPYWSFSYPKASFTSATVTMTQGDKTIPVSLEQVQNGYGENTLVWTPQGESWSKPPKDKTYTVTVNNVGTGTGPRNFTYKVTVFDPEVGRAVPGAWLPLQD